ncbi:MAG TPA: CocE/NonD family hydrolase, partial [Gemmatimonadales bacterium]|nr:CocE/NonD family hydrolase [Gemmatimonadales bacterium]
MRLSACCLAALVLASSARAQQSTSAPVFTFQEVMVPVRDGVHLQTVILAPASQTGPLPILFRRTPYGVPDAAPTTIPPSFKELMQDGYIFVFQNLRGR